MIMYHIKDFYFFCWSPNSCKNNIRHAQLTAAKSGGTVSKRQLEKNFMSLSLEAWTNFVLQVVKVFLLNRVTPKSFRKDCMQLTSFRVWRPFLVDIWKLFVKSCVSSCKEVIFSTTLDTGLQHSRSQVDGPPPPFFHLYPENFNFHNYNSLCGLILFLFLVAGPGAIRCPFFFLAAWWSVRVSVASRCISFSMYSFFRSKSKISRTTVPVSGLTKRSKTKS